MFRSNRKTRKGFSLVELVVVILIIAILAAAIFLGGATVINQARASQVKSDLRNLATYAQDMLYENPDLQYSTAKFGSKENFSYDATTGTLKYSAEAADKTGLADLPVATLMNDKYLTDDFQLTEVKDAWDNPYTWSYQMSPAATSGDPASCIIVINSLGRNSRDESSDAVTADAGKSVPVATTVIDALGNADNNSATKIVENAAIAGETGDDYGAVIVMVGGEVSMDYYGF